MKSDSCRVQVHPKPLSSQTWKFHPKPLSSKYHFHTFDGFSRRKLIEDRDIILKLTARIQELQNEVNCMNDSRDFQDTESVRSGNSHVTSQSVSFAPHPIPGEMLSRSKGMPSRREGPPSIWDTHGFSEFFFFCRSSCVLFSTLSTWIESMEFRKSRTDSLINSGEGWERNTSSRSEMSVRTVSQKFSHPWWGRLFKELRGRPITTAVFRSSFWQIPDTSNVCLLEDQIQDWGMYLFTISYGSYAMVQRSDFGWISGWSKIFLFCKRYSNAKF